LLQRRWSRAQSFPRLPARPGSIAASYSADAKSSVNGGNAKDRDIASSLA
jgi:hypothetical protein